MSRFFEKKPRPKITEAGKAEIVVDLKNTYAPISSIGIINFFILYKNTLTIFLIFRSPYYVVTNFYLDALDFSILDRPQRF